MTPARALASALRAVSFAIAGVLRVYQVTISPLLGPRCRFYPSCSQYAVDAVLKYGPFRGVWLACARLARCHPWSDGGVDLVP